MAKQFPALSDEHAAFIARQHIFFAASATADSRINLSPREASAFRVLGPNSACYLDQTGSGAETAAHLLVDGRLTIMFCSFEKVPLILRLYGTARSLMRGTPDYAAVLQTGFDGAESPGARQIVLLEVALVQTSCGYGVPFFDFVSERQQLKTWAAGQGDGGMAEYRARKNTVSLDGLPTGFGTTPTAE
ncbi:hypothetical protein sos41_43560 [Alphaproteobacteria bacterium SO-S41]|nr:hypothetical protein sos41_43560 [Alphaproteobacteria bacterium SO-S41]